MKYLLLFLFCCVLLGCATLQERKDELLSQSVYAAKDSSEKNRFDLSKEWINKVAKLVPAPKSRIKIESAKVKDQNIVILPSGTDPKNILVVDSKEYNDIIKENKDFKNLIESGREILEKKENEIIKLKKDIEEYKEYNKPWNVFKRWVTGFGVLGAIAGIGLGALFFFNPALFGVVMKVVGAVIEIIMRIIKAVIDWIKFIIAKIQDWNDKE